MAASKKRIAVLGGGVGSLSTAFALTSQPGWQEHYEITIYQMGWRLGGKGASGRNREKDKQHRVEEHGFHVWLGFYDNAFKMIKETYAELALKTGPLRTWQDAFQKHSLIVLEEHHNGQRKRWQVDFPTGPREPGTVVQLGLIGYAARMFRLLMRRLPDTKPKQNMRQPPDAIANQNPRQPWVVRIVQRVWRTMFLGVLLLLTLAQYLLRLAERRVERRVNEAQRAKTVVTATLNPVRALLAMASKACRAMIDGITGMVVEWAKSTDTTDDDDARRLMIFFDLSLAILRGIIVDEVMVNGFESIDHIEFRDWLRRHNARPETLDSALIKSIYDGNFCYTKGDRTRPNFAAGVALHCYLRIFLDYKGAFLYKMQAGMGDVVIAPLYLLLKKRGVQFKFFHKVDRLVYDHSRQEITAIEMTEQVALAGSDYDPLIRVEVTGGTMECWPSAPKFELIRDGDELEQSGINLESQWSAVWKDSRRRTVAIGEGQEHDLVVLGISIGALPGICSDLVARRPEWRLMIEHVDTVATQAMQLWLSRDVTTLGWPLRSPLVVSYEDPCPNWLDATQVIPNEMLMPDTVRSVAYFCSALADPSLIPLPGAHTYPADQLLVVQQAHEQWIHRHCGHLWPAFVAGAQLSVNWDMLHDGLNRAGAARFEWQYFRANVEPSDRFVASSAGATQFRLRPDGSGVHNLYLAGDWTRNGLNAGCIEATVFSGFLCSRAIAGYPAKIMGEHPFNFGLGGR